MWRTLRKFWYELKRMVNEPLYWLFVGGFLGGGIGAIGLLTWFAAVCILGICPLTNFIALGFACAAVGVPLLLTIIVAAVAVNGAFIFSQAPLKQGEYEKLVARGWAEFEAYEAEQSKDLLSLSADHTRLNRANEASDVSDQSAQFQGRSPRK